MRYSLRIMLTLMGLFGVSVLAWFLLRSLQPSVRAKAGRETMFAIEPLLSGEIRRVQTGGISVLLLRPTPEQWQAIHRMTPHVWDPSLDAYKPDISAFVYIDADTKFGCELMIIPPGESNMVRFSYPKDANAWFGGYVDACHRDRSYDLAGRSIRTREYSYNGYDARLPNLESPTIRKSGDAIVMQLPKWFAGAN